MTWALAILKHLWVNVCASGYITADYSGFSYVSSQRSQWSALDWRTTSLKAEERWGLKSGFPTESVAQEQRTRLTTAQSVVHHDGSYLRSLVNWVQRKAACSASDDKISLNKNSICCVLFFLPLWGSRNCVWACLNPINCHSLFLNLAFGFTIALFPPALRAFKVLSRFYLASGRSFPQQPALWQTRRVMNCFHDYILMK